MAKRKKIDKLTPPEHCASVKEYEKTPYWANKSLLVLNEKDAVCIICKRPRWKEYVRTPGKYKRITRNSLHHTTYAHLPYEQEGELLCLCNCCHTFCHEALRYRNLSPMYEKVAQIVEQYFQYDGIKTFVPW
jgi:hypothetical protein